MSRLVLIALLVLFMVLILRAIKQPEARRGPRPPGNANPPAGGGRMTREEAFRVLGLKEGASEKDILSAYRRLMKKVHPDQPNGSTYLASKLNQAKETLLG